MRREKAPKKRGGAWRGGGILSRQNPSTAPSCSGGGWRQPAAAAADDPSFFSSERQLFWLISDGPNADPAPEQPHAMMSMKLFAAVALISPYLAEGFNVVLAGGSGVIGKTLSSSLVKDGHDVTILCRNAFLAAAPARVTSEFGWVGRTFLEKHPGVKLRDWDGGDLLDIVGQDFLGWQEDTLSKADAVVNLVGGFTQQREMAAERIVRESLRVNPTALQITVGPRDDELQMVSPGAKTAKVARLKQCEDLVSVNCANFECLRIEANKVEQECERIKQVLYHRLQ